MSEASPNPIAAPASTSTPKDDGFARDFGGGEVAAVQREPVVAKPEFNPKTVDWYRTPPEQIPEEFRPYQAQLKGQLAEQTRANQRAAELERQIQQMQQQMQQQGEGRLAQAIEKLTPQEDPYADLKSRLDPEEQGAIDVVREILKRELGQSLPDLNPVQQRMQVLEQAVVMMAQHFQAQQQQGQVSDLQAAYEKHGAALETVAPNIRALIGTQKPGTSRNWTVQEAADLFLGAQAGGIETARQVDREERGRAKRGAQGSVGATVGSPQGSMTDAELMSQLADIGFK